MRKRPRKITLRDITEEQFITILKKVCQPISKPKQRIPKQLEVVDEARIAERK